MILFITQQASRNGMKKMFDRYKIVAIGIRRTNCYRPDRCESIRGNCNAFGYCYGETGTIDLILVDLILNDSFVVPSTFAASV